MKTVILAGGYGTRLSEETGKVPKPLVKIGEMPIIWHIMKQYYHYGFNDFIICAGYKQHEFKKFFSNYYFYQNDIYINTKSGIREINSNRELEDWNIRVVDTGINTATGGRIKKIKPYLNDFKNETNFFLTYGDGVSDVNIKKLLEFHNAHGKLVTLTSIQAPEKYGILDIDENDVITAFEEKPEGENKKINGGFMVLNKKVIDYIDDDTTMFEQAPLRNLAKENQLVAYHHNGFWKSMDILREKEELNNMWENKKADWKVW